MDRWRDRASLLKEWYESRKRERIHEDGSFMHHQKGPITATYTADWNLREGEYRGKLGDWVYDNYKQFSLERMDSRITKADIH